MEDDTFLSSEVIFHRVDVYLHIVKSIDRERVHDINLEGRINDKLILDTIRYLVQYPYGSEDVRTYARVVEYPFQSSL